MFVQVKYLISKCSTNLVSSLVSLITVGVRVTQLRVVHVETNSVWGPLTWLSIERGWPAYRIKFTVVSPVHVLSVCIV